MADLERNKPVAIKWDLNIGTLVSIGLPLVGGMLWLNTQITSLESRVNQADKSVVDLTIAVKTLQESTLRQSGDVNNLNYRMGQGEANVLNINARIDRIADSVITSLDAVKKDVNALGTKVEVMNQKIDSLDVPRTKAGKI